MKKIRRIMIVLAACILMVGLTNIGTINVQAASTEYYDAAEPPVRSS